ncbi:MAG TPA: aminoglycoside adenylyltransferase domain-containing protein, partial [Gaiellaceae bacterium]|nr:aminoglycoside adenylyltransferase domain-containing protein [Gaiellaceae bacterium]
EVLGDDLLGAYLHGSAVLGGMTPSSDVDVLAVSRRPLRAGEPRRLYDGLIAITRRPRTVELTVVVHDEVQPWRYPPRRELQYGEWFRTEYEAGRDAGLYPVDDPDLTTLLTIVLDRGVALHGPRPQELLDPVPRGDLRRAMLENVEHCETELEGDERNILLTLARMWMTLATGEIGRKDAAAAWALERVDLPALARARDLYLAGERGDWEPAEAQATARVLSEEIRRA